MSRYNTTLFVRFKNILPTSLEHVPYVYTRVVYTSKPSEHYPKDISNHYYPNKYIVSNKL